MPDISSLVKSQNKVKPGSEEFILQEISKIFQPSKDEIYELRAIKKGKFTEIRSGYFDNLKDLAESAQSCCGNYQGVYITLNPVNTALFARCANHTHLCGDGDTTKDDHIEKRRRLLIDHDCTPVTGVSSTEKEHDDAAEMAFKTKALLLGEGFPDAALCDSGNGAHLIYRLDCDENDNADKLIQEFLVVLQNHVGEGKLRIDLSVHNSARITKLYGTKACKGESISDRPHRYSKIIYVPETYEILQIETLAAFIRKYKPLEQEKKKEEQKQNPEIKDKINIEGIISQKGFVIKKKEAWNGGWKWELDCCPFCHNGSGCCVITWTQNKAGNWHYGFKCHHNSCIDNKWKKLKELWGIETSENLPKKIIAKCKEMLTFFHYKENGYAMTKSPCNTLKIKDKQFAAYISSLFPNLIIKNSMMKDVIEHLEHLAWRGDKQTTYLRVAKIGDDIFVDLANQLRQIIKINKDGWSVINDYQIPFLRNENIAPLPVPDKGDINLLREFLNCSDNDFTLIKGFLLDCYKGYSPYYGLGLSGEQGSCKSVGSNLIRRCFDPVIDASLRSINSPEEDLILGADNNSLLGFDNISYIDQNKSDLLARLLTGSGFGMRKHFSQDKEVVYSKAMPIILNGIPDVIEHADLADRVMKIVLFEPEARKEERQLYEDFEKVLPKIFGGICDLIVEGIKNFKTTKIEGHYRMADSIKWIVSCSQSNFLDCFNYNKKDSSAILLEAATIAPILMDWIRNKGSSDYQSSDFLDEFLNVKKITSTSEFADGNEYKTTDLVNNLVKFGNDNNNLPDKFPIKANKFSAKIKKEIPILKGFGVKVKYRVKDGYTLWQISTVKSGENAFK